MRENNSFTAVHHIGRKAERGEKQNCRKSKEAIGNERKGKQREQMMKYVHITKRREQLMTAITATNNNKGCKIKCLQQQDEQLHRCDKGKTAKANYPAIRLE